MELSHEQKLWLQSRGGRSIFDVFMYENKPCVFMRRNKQDFHIFIPPTERLKIIKRKRGYTKYQTVIVLEKPQ
jgi:hypothetical protein